MIQKQRWNYSLVSRFPEAIFSVTMLMCHKVT